MDTEQFNSLNARLAVIEYQVKHLNKTSDKIADVVVGLRVKVASIAAIAAALTTLAIQYLVR